MPLLQHQQDNVSKLVASLSAHGAALDASDVGTGKTYTAIGLCAQLGAQPAVICPLATVPSWEAVCKEMGVNPVFIANYERLKSKSFPFGTFESSVVLNRNGKPKHERKFTLKNIPPRTIFIFDEVQRCRAKTSENSFILTEVVRRYKTLLLSATPFTTPLEAYPIGRALKLFSMDGYYSWCLRHGVRRNSHFGNLEFKGDWEDMARIHAQIFPLRGVRTRREEIPGFPETQVSADLIGCAEPNEINRSYLDELALTEMQDIERARAGVPEELWEFVTPLAITRDMRARQRAELLKVPAMSEMAYDAMSKGSSVAVFLNFDASIMLFRQYVETECVFCGNLEYYAKNGNRAQKVAAFQEGRSPIILVNAQAGGAGLNLHDPVNKTPRHSLISPPWSAIVLRQILGRVQRTHGGFSRQQILFAAGTVEERVMRRVHERLNNLDALTDGDLDPLFSVTQ